MTKLVTSTEVAGTIDWAMDEIGPNWQDHKVYRRLIDRLFECQCYIETMENAARLRAKSSSPMPMDHSGVESRPNGTSETAAAFQSDHAKAFHKLAAAVFCPPAQDDEPDQRARNAGVGA